MATFTSTSQINIRWKGVWEFSGPAGTVFTIADDLYDEFNGEMASAIPGLTWLTTSDYFDANSGGTITGNVIIQGALTATSSLTANSFNTLAFSASNGGDIFAATMTATNVLTKGIPTYNVMAYGAAGDGVTDDTAAIQAAFDACASGGIVFFPIGTFLFSSTLELPYPAEIKGSGRSNGTMLKYTGGAGTAIQFANRTVSEQRNFMLIHDFELRNAGGSSSVIAMDMKGLCRSTISNIYIAAFTGATAIGLLVDASYGTAVGAWWNTIEKITTDAVGTGVKFTGVSGAGQANENRVRDCDFLGHSVAGVDVDVGDDIYITNCDFSTGQGGTGVIANDNCATIRSCRFEMNTSGSIGVHATSSGTPDRVRIEDCLIIAASGATGILLDNGVTNAKVVHNRITGAGTSLVDNSTANQSNISTRGQGLVALQFGQANVSANQSSVALVPLGADSGATLIYPGRSFQVRGVTISLSAAQTAGTITVHATIGSTPGTLYASGTSGTIQASWQGMGIDTGTSTQRVGAKITTDASFAPTTADLIATVYIEYTS